MDISKIGIKEKKLYLTNFFKKIEGLLSDSDEIFVTMKVIPREVYKYIEILLQKKKETQIYFEIAQNFDEEKNSLNNLLNYAKTKKEKDDIEKQIKNIEVKIFEIYKSKFVNEISKMKNEDSKTQIENQTFIEKSCIEYGLSKDKHSFSDGAKLVELDYDLFLKFSYLSDNGVSIIDFISEEVLDFQRGLQLGE